MNVNLIIEILIIITRSLPESGSKQPIISFAGARS
jgi:hypothetical protein